MKKKVALIAIVFGMFACLATGVYAGSHLKEIKAYLNGDLKIRYNGTPVQLQDAQGQAILPITYNNSTYLPLRAVSDLLKTAVAYDSKSNTVYLGEKIDGVSIAGGFRDQHRIQDPQYTEYAGKDYKDVFLNNIGGRRSVSFMLYPEGKYQTLVLQAAALGADIEELVIRDSDTDVTLKKTSLSVSEGMKTIEVNIAGSKSLYIYTSSVEEDGGLFVPLTTSYYK